MFVGRKEELNKLNELYESSSFAFAVVYGRRRVGKTTLIREFIKDKRAVYFSAREADGELNLQSFSNDVYKVTANEQAATSLFAGWEQAFAYLGRIANNERLVLVIDEYPYLAGSYPAISSILQAHIDTTFKDSKLFLILCGSSMSFMENQVLGYKSPLYGRRTTQFKITPFSFFDSLPFINSFKPKDQAILYGVTGGIPQYLQAIDAAKTVEKNIIELFLSPSGILFEEPANLLKQELREPATYNRIVEALASGSTRLNEIATHCHMESNKCAKYLKSLIALGIVKKEQPVTDNSPKRSIYLLDDMMFRFWYRFVFPNMSAINQELGSAVYDFEVSEELSAYMGSVFEDICAQYLWLEAKRDALPFFPANIGRWWGNNSRLKRQEEIDILAFRKQQALFCECKWTHGHIGQATLDTLISRSELFTYQSKWYWLFAKTGFSKGLTESASKQANIRLITFASMLDEFPR
jgi:AAA+ ATPase superfamily predicted ATPase